MEATFIIHLLTVLFLQQLNLIIRMNRTETMNIMTRARAMKITGSEFVWIVCRTALPPPGASAFHDGMFGNILTIC